MTYGDVWVQEMWRPVHQYGWVRSDPDLVDVHMEMLAEKRRVLRAARKARASESTGNPQAINR